MGGDENGHVLIARKIDQQLPELVPRQRIDARGRLVKDEHLGLMHDGDGERKPLANSQRQIRGALIEIVCKAELLDQLPRRGFALAAGMMEKSRMKIEILPDRELGIERE